MNRTRIRSPFLAKRGLVAGKPRPVDGEAAEGVVPDPDDVLADAVAPIVPELGVLRVYEEGPEEFPPHLVRRIVVRVRHMCEPYGAARNS